MSVTLTLWLLAAALGLLVYGIAQQLPFPPEPLPPKRAGILDPLLRQLEVELELRRIGLPVRLFLYLSLGSAGLGYLLARPFQNDLLTLIVAGALGASPYQVLRSQVRKRNLAITKITLPALMQIAQICEVRQHPFLALTDAAPVLADPLKSELEQALMEAQSGLSLPDALRRMAARCSHNFYLHQMAELVAINIQDGGDLAANLRRLAGRLRTMEELRAEESAELYGYRWLTRLLYAATLLPLGFWAVTGSATLQFFVQTPLGRVLTIWVVVSGLVILSLPYWMAIDD